MSAVQFANDGWGGYITVCGFRHMEFRLSHVRLKPSLSSAVWGNPLLNAADAEKSAAIVTAAFESVGGKTVFYTMSSPTDFFDTFIAPNTDVSLGYTRLINLGTHHVSDSPVRRTATGYGVSPYSVRQSHR